jgi:hypothetical protein
VAVTVNTINRMFRAGLQTHVGNKVFELPPSLTNANPSSTVKMVSNVFGVRASLNRVIPRLILAGNGSIQSVPMLIAGCFLSKFMGKPFYGFFRSKAPTTLNFPRAKIFGNGRSFIFAHALAKPKNSAILIRQSLKYCEATECLAP